jgi:hypothetical protein
VFAALWVVAPQYLLIPLAPYGYLATIIGIAVFRAIVLAYVAFPFAVTYDETAFRGYY